MRRWLLLGWFFLSMTEQGAIMKHGPFVSEAQCQSLRTWVLAQEQAGRALRVPAVSTCWTDGGAK